MLQTEGRNYKLAKNQYEGYQYIDLDNFYTYENSFVLINKQNILDPNLAKNNEHLYVSKRLADLYMLPIPVYSMTDILKLKFVFLKMILYIIPIWTEPYMATYRK